MSLVPLGHLGILGNLDFQLNLATLDILVDLGLLGILVLLVFPDFRLM